VEKSIFIYKTTEIYIYVVYNSTKQMQKVSFFSYIDSGEDGMPKSAWGRSHDSCDWLISANLNLASAKIDLPLPTAARS